jgi:hypothetical protein
MDYEAIREEINRLHGIMEAAPSEVKMGYSVSYGGVLNAYREGDITFARAQEVLADIASRSSDHIIDVNKMDEPTPAEQGKGLEQALARAQEIKNLEHLGAPIGQGDAKYVVALAGALLSSRPQPEAEKVVPKKMLREIANLWHAYGWMPQQMGEIVTKYMPGYTVKE